MMHKRKPRSSRLAAILAVLTLGYSLISPVTWLVRRKTRALRLPPGPTVRTPVLATAK